MNPEETSTLIQRAREGDEWAWNLIVDEYSSLVWSVVRGFRLDNAASADAIQKTWLALLEHLQQIREPARLPGWLRTTARRACLGVLRESGRELLVDEVWPTSSTNAARPEPEWGAPETDVLHREQLALLRVAIASLPATQRALLELLTATPSLSYRQISERLGIPIGSIGPTRARILERLRRRLHDAGLYDAVPA